MDDEDRLSFLERRVRAPFEVRWVTDGVFTRNALHHLPDFWKGHGPRTHAGSEILSAEFRGSVYGTYTCRKLRPS